MAAEHDGQKVFIQTDHRSPEEMDETPEISAVFALVRTLLPKRLGDEGHPARVRYAALAGASAGVAEAVAATGAELESMASGAPEIIAYRGTPRTPAEIVDAAFAALAHRVALREGLPISGEGLATFEERLRAQGLDTEEEEIEGWTGIVELAAFTGECIRRRDEGGHWSVTDELFTDHDKIAPADFGLLPFVFSGKGGMVQNAANKAIRAMTEPGQSCVQMLVSTKPAEGEPGVTMVVLKPPGWGTHGVYARPLMASYDESPVAVIAEDHPNNVAYPTSDDDDDDAREALFAKALANLAEVEVEVEKLDLGIEMDLYVVHGHFYAAEKILDEAFMHRMHALLRQELLAVAVPVKSRMFITAGIQAPDNLARLMALAQSVYEKEAHPISPRVFGVMGGKVSAMIQPSGDEPAPEPTKKKGFWSRLFN